MSDFYGVDYQKRYQEASEWLKEEHGDGNEHWVNALDIRDRIVEKEDECISLKRALLSTLKERNRLYHAIDALRDPKGHIFHGGDVCTPECQEINAIIKIIEDEVPHNKGKYESCCGDLPTTEGSKP